MYSGKVVVVMTITNCLRHPVVAPGLTLDAITNEIDTIITHSRASSGNSISNSNPHLLQRESSVNSNSGLNSRSTRTEPMEDASLISINSGSNPQLLRRESCNGDSSVNNTSGLNSRPARRDSSVDSVHSATNSSHRPMRRESSGDSAIRNNSGSNSRPMRRESSSGDSGVIGDLSVTGSAGSAVLQGSNGRIKRGVSSNLQQHGVSDK